MATGSVLGDRGPPNRCELQWTGLLRTSPEVGTGGASGLGSVIYTLCKVAALLDRGDLLDTATRASTLLDTERVATAPLDVFAGPGEIPAPWPAHRDEGPGRARPRPGASDQPLATAKPARRASRLAHSGGRMLTGFARSRRIAYALGRLSAETGRNRVPRGCAGGDPLRGPALRSRLRQLAGSARDTQPVQR